MKTRFLFALFFVVAWPLLADEDDRTGFRVTKKETASGVILMMKSDYCSEYTVTVEADLENMTPSRPVPFTVDAAGRTAFELVRFKVTDTTKAWRYQYRYYWQFGRRRDSTDAHDADYAMPFGPGRYVVMQGPLGNYSHFAGSGNENAVDWGVPEGTPVLAAREGRVVGVRADSAFSGTDPKFKPLANYVIIKHADGTFADYRHLKTGNALVKLGDEVKVGQLIGLSGNTGYSTKPHLHFGVFQAIDGKKVLSLPFRLKTDRGVFTEFVIGREY